MPYIPEAFETSERMLFAGPLDLTQESSAVITPDVPLVLNYVVAHHEAYQYGVVGTVNVKCMSAQLAADVSNSLLVSIDAY